MTLLDGDLPFTSLERLNILQDEDPTQWWIRERRPTTTTTTTTTTPTTIPELTISICSRTAVNNQALAGVTVEYSVAGTSLGSLITGPEGKGEVIQR